MNAIKALNQRVRVAFRARLARWFFSDTPLIWTTAGNVPVGDLDYAVEWSENEETIRFMEIYRIRGTGEIVKQSVHLQLKQGLSLNGEQGQVS